MTEAIDTDRANKYFSPNAHKRSELDKNYSLYVLTLAIIRLTSIYTPMFATI